MQPREKGKSTGNLLVDLAIYALLDVQSAPALPNSRPAARVLTTVTSRPEPSSGITDTGQKAMGIDQGLPTVDDMPDVDIVALSAEHCRMRLGDRAQTLRPGDKLWLTPYDIGTCTNLFDSLYGMRDGVLDRIWPIAARGRYR